jgi:KipI family sensor histidine kinase inhibitor
MTEAAPIRPDLRHASDHTLLVTFAEEISPGAHRRVRQALAVLQAEPLPGVTDLHPAYASLLVSYDPTVADRDELRRQVADRIAMAGETTLPEPRDLEIPVAYGGEHGPDLQDVANACGLSPAEVIRQHASGDYLVYFLGFSPGFPYLGGIPPAIAVPRRARPRTRLHCFRWVTDCGSSGRRLRTSQVRRMRLEQASRRPSAQARSRWSTRAFRARCRTSAGPATRISGFRRLVRPIRFRCGLATD